MVIRVFKHHKRLTSLEKVLKCKMSSWNRWAFETNLTEKSCTTLHFLIFFAVTLVTLAIMALLFMYELHDYLTPKLAEDLFVDTTRGSKLKINIDVVFSSIPCNSMYAISNVPCVLILEIWFEDKSEAMYHQRRYKSKISEILRKTST